MGHIVARLEQVYLNVYTNHQTWWHCGHGLLKIDLQLRLPQQHCLRSRDDSIADQRSSIFSYFNYWLLIIIVYTACILNYAHKIASF